MGRVAVIAHLVQPEEAVIFYPCGSSPGSPTSYADHSGLTRRRYYGAGEIRTDQDHGLRYRLLLEAGVLLLVFGVVVAGHAANSFGLGRGSHKVRAQRAGSALAVDARLMYIDQEVGPGKRGHEEDKTRQKEDNRDVVVDVPWGLDS